MPEHAWPDATAGSGGGGGGGLSQFDVAGYNISAPLNNILSFGQPYPFVVLEPASNVAIGVYIQSNSLDSTATFTIERNGVPVGGVGITVPFGGTGVYAASGLSTWFPGDRFTVRLTGSTIGSLAGTCSILLK